MDSVLHELCFTQQTGHAPKSRATLVVISNLCQSRLFLCRFAVDYSDFNPTLPEFKAYLRPLEGVKSSTAIVRFGDSYSSLHVEMWGRWMYSLLNPISNPPQFLICPCECSTSFKFVRGPCAISDRWIPI